MKHDYFEQKLAERLKNQEITPPADLWQRLESTLDSAPIPTTVITPKRKKYLSFIIGGTAAAAAILLSFLLINNEQATETPVIAKIELPNTITTPSIQTKQDTILQNIVLNQIAENREVRKKNTKTAIENELPTTIVQGPEKVEETPSEEQETKVLDERKTKATRSLTTSGVNSTSSQRTYSEITGRGKKEKSNGIRLNISGSGNIGSASSTTNSNMFANSIRDMNGSTPILYVATEKKIDWQHTIPISISATVQKMFTRKIGIETGITYTYLSSHSNVDSKPKIDIKQRLHYLGIPISIIYNIAEVGNFNFYAKGGFLVDKAISAEYKTYLEEKSISERLDSKGVQWTTSLQVGGEYKIGKMVSLYVEPTVNYYFDSQQPDSYRTENDFGFSAIVGVRFKL